MRNLVNCGLLSHFLGTLLVSAFKSIFRRKRDNEEEEEEAEEQQVRFEPARTGPPQFRTFMLLV